MVLADGPGRRITDAPGAAREVHLVGACVAGARALRQEFPHLWFHAGVPPDLDPAGALDLASCGPDSLSLHAGALEDGPGTCERWRPLPLPLVVSATYGPETSGEALVALLGSLRTMPSLRCLVLLPGRPGGRSLGPGDTDGVLDARLVALARLALPRRVRVRSSWAAFGWKMAQFLLACGADEVAGGGLEENLAWGRGFEPAAVVSAEQARAGIREAGFRPVEVRGCAWES